MKTAIRLIISIGLSVLFLWLAYRDVQWRSVMGFLGQADPLYALLGFVSIVVMYISRVIRWGILIEPFAKISTKGLFRVCGVGFLLMFALPLRLGELARPILLKREANTPFSKGLASVAVERVIDGVIVTGFFFFAITLVGPRVQVPAPIQAGAYGALVLFVSAAIALTMAMFMHERFVRIAHWIADPISKNFASKVVLTVDAFLSGLRALPSVGSVLSFTLWTVGYWGANGLSMYFVMLAFGWDVPMIAGFILVCIVVFGIMIPAGPGFLGTFQASLALGVSMFGVPVNEGAAYGLVVYPMTLAVVIAFGLWPLLSVKVRDVIASPAVETGEDAS